MGDFAIQEKLDKIGMLHSLLVRSMRTGIPCILDKASLQIKKNADLEHEVVKWRHRECILDNEKDLRMFYFDCCSF